MYGDPIIDTRFRKLILNRLIENVRVWARVHDNRGYSFSAQIALSIGARANFLRLMRAKLEVCTIHVSIIGHLRYNMQIVEWSQGNCGVEPGKLRSWAREIVEWSQENCGVEPGKLWRGARKIVEWSQENCGVEPGKLWRGARKIVEWSQGNCGVEPGKLWNLNWLA